MQTSLVSSSASRPRASAKLVALFAAALTAASLASSGHAGQVTWQGNLSGNMSDATNWVGGVAPVANSDAIRLGVAGTAGTSLVQNTSLQYSGNLTLGIPSIFFDSSAPAYTISGNGSILIGTGSIISNSTFTQTINNNLRRNTSNPITIGANGGGLVLNGSWDTANGTTFAGFGATNGGSIALNGNFINSTGSVAGLTITTTTGGSGIVTLGGNNTALNGNLTLSSVLLKLNNPAAVASGATVNQSTGSFPSVWLANDSAANSINFNLTGPNTAGSSMRLVLDRATPGAAYDQAATISNFGQQTNLIVQKGARVTSGTATLTVSGNSSFGVASGGKVSLFSTRDVNATVGNISAVALTGNATATSALVLDGTSLGNTVTGVIANNASGNATHTVSLGKAGPGTWTLAGNNTFTGVTAVNGGTLALDFASASTDANILYNGVSPAIVTLGGGTLKLSGKADTANSQVFASLAFIGGTESKISLVAGSGNSTVALTTTGNFTVNTGSVVDFSLGAGTSVQNTAYTAAATFISGGVTIGGTEFARYDATGTIVAPVPANYQAMTGNNTAGSSTYASLTGSLTRNAGADLPFKGLKIASSGTDDTFDLNGANATFTNSGILYTGGGNGNYTIANGSLRTTTSSTSLILNVAPSARLNIPASTGLDNNPNGTSIADIIKAGQGTLVVTGNKNFTGKARVLNGTYSFDSLANAASPSGLGASANVNTNLVLSGGVLQYTGPAASTDRTFQIGSNGATLDASGTGPVTWAPALALGFTNNANTGTGTAFSQNQFITFAGSNTDANTFGSTLGLLADPSGGGQLSVTKSGAGTWVLNGANTYTGATSVNSGILAVAGTATPGISGPLGRFGDIVFGGGTLQFSASNTADYSSRIRNSSAAIKLDTNGQSVTLASELDASNIGGLTKLGGGTLTLAAAHAYAGPTTVSAGTLALAAADRLPDTSALVLDGGTFDVAGLAETLGTLDVNGPATLALGSGGTVVFANSSAVAWDASAALTISGSFVSGASLRFGSDATALSPAQLAAISIAGYTIVDIDSSGYLTASNAPASAYAAWAAGAGLDAGNNGAAQDPDGDGVVNVLEFVFGGLPLTRSSAILPSQSTTATDLVLSFKRSDESEAQVGGLVVQYGTNLSTWTSFAISAATSGPNANGVVVTVSENGAAADDVSVSIPLSLAVSGRLFARVQATHTLP